MKIFFLFVLVVCICFVISACTATDPDNLFEIEPDNTVASAQENLEDTTGSLPEDTQPDTEDIVYYTGAYQYGNVQNNCRFLLIDNEVVFPFYRYTKDGNSFFSRIFSYDLISNEVHSFCRDATCTHEACKNSPFSRPTMEVYNGKLYGINANDYVVEANENGAKIITEVPVSYGFFHYGDKLYIRTKDSSLVAFEEGKKEPQVVVEEYVGSNAVIFDDYLYADGGMGLIRIDLTAEEPKAEDIVPNVQGITDGQYIYYVDMKDWYLYRCDMDGSNAQLLFEKPVLRASMNFDDEYFYLRFMKEMDYEVPIVTSFASLEEQQKYYEERQKYMDELICGSSDRYDLYRFPKEDPTNIEKIATLPRHVYGVYTVPGTDKIFVKTCYEPGDEHEIYYVMGTDGSDPTMLEIPEY